ncbi:unnamed protein product, partial [Rotaria sp. Silwood1]
MDSSISSNINNFQESYDQSSNPSRLNKSEKPSTTTDSISSLASTTRKNNSISLSTTSAKNSSVSVSPITNSL